MTIGFFVKGLEALGAKGSGILACGQAGGYGQYKYLLHEVWPLAFRETSMSSGCALVLCRKQGVKTYKHAIGVLL